MSSPSRSQDESDRSPTIRRGGPGKRLISVGTAMTWSRAASAGLLAHVDDLVGRRDLRPRVFVADVAHGLDGMDGARGRAIDIEGQGPPVHRSVLPVLTLVLTAELQSDQETVAI